MDLIVKTNGKIDVVVIDDATIETLKNKPTPEMICKYKYPNINWENASSSEYKRLNIKMAKMEIESFKKVLECLQKNDNR